MLVLLLWARRPLLLDRQSLVFLAQVSEDFDQGILRFHELFAFWLEGHQRQGRAWDTQARACEVEISLSTCAASSSPLKAPPPSPFSGCLDSNLLSLYGERA